MSSDIDELSVRREVKEHYAKLAQQIGGGASCCDAGCGCGGNYVTKIGYADEAIKGVPQEALEVSAGCGNPTAIASLKLGQTVLDLGSGGGIDVFIAAEAVGVTGKAIGVDSTPEMVWRARKAAREMGVQNVEFRLGEIECMPIESGSVDVAISNCVINLSPDKDRVFREVFRALKPGGRLAVSDMVLTVPIDRDEREMLRTWSGCIGGAISEAEYLQKIEAAGFVEVLVESRHVYTHEELSDMVSSVKTAEGTGATVLDAGDGRSKVATVRVSAVKSKGRARKA